MPDNPFVSTAELTSARLGEIAAATPGVIGAARWFWWIVGLSLVNTILAHTGSDRTFIIGLGFTLVTDMLFQSLRPVAFAIDALALAFFFVMGRYASKGYLWAFLVGGIAYACDAVIYLIFQDFMSLAFHGWALFSLYTGATALRRALKAADSLGPEPGATNPPGLPTSSP